MQGTVNNKSLTIPAGTRSLAMIALVALLGVGGTYIYGKLRSPDVLTPESPEIALPELKTVTALGHLEPEGEVVNLTAPTSSQESRIEELLVKVGDSVKAGDVIAILDSRARLQASYKQAQQDVEVSRARLAQVQAGAKVGEIATQKAEITRLEADQQARITAQQANVERLQAEVHNAQVEYQRYDSLYQEGAISASARDTRQLTLQTSQRNLKQAQAELTRLQSTRSPELAKAQATLSSMTEVRPVDVQVSQAELQRAIAAAAQSKASLEQAFVRSTQDGVIMDIHTQPGEVITTEEGIVEIGQIEQMVAIAEVYESDVQKLKPGQMARIFSNALPNELRGTVTWVDLKVHRQTVINTDPSENIDAKIVEVRVQLDPKSSKEAAKFTNLQVEVEIEVD